MHKKDVHSTTAYYELIALKCISTIYPNLFNFDYCVENRKNLSKFPDWEFGDNQLEVVRLFDDQIGKTIKDTNDVFNSINKKDAITNKQIELDKYEAHGNPHNIQFSLNNNHVIAYTKLYSDEELCNILCNVLKKKNDEYLKNRHDGKNIFLFVVSTEEIIDIHKFEYIIQNTGFLDYKKIFIGAIHNRDYYVFEFENNKLVDEYFNLNLVWNDFKEIVIEKKWD